MIQTMYMTQAHEQARVFEPVVALHSSASTAAQWKALTATLGERHRMIVPDLPGYGTAAGGLDLNAPANLAVDADAMLRVIGGSAETFHLVGHSYGGAVALKLAMMHPWRVRSLTLIEPVVFHLLLRDGGDEDMRLYRGILGIRDRIRGALAAGWPAYGMAAFVDFWNGTGTWDRAEPELRQRLAAQARVVLRNFTAVLDETWPLAQVARLPMPMLTIAGTQSPAVTQRLTGKLIEAAKDVTAARIFGAGHMAPLTHAAAVNSLIARHVRLAEEAEASAQRGADFRRAPAAA